ncbi:putative ABC-type amino acid transport periplasmic binding domain protein [Candidatus Hepatincolaceae symbiont of Richtersius coronifer]
MIQIFKKISIILFLAFLASCSFTFDPAQKATKNQEIPLKVGILLPLTGKQASLGQETLQAIHLAYAETRNPYVLLKIYDTKGDPIIAKDAAKKAINGGARVIIGPILSEETKVVFKVAEANYIPVISLSNDIDNLVGNENAYILANLPIVDIERIIDYAVSVKGARKFAALVPQNKYGEVILATIKESLKARNLELVVYSSYPINEAKLVPYLQRLIPEDELIKYKEIDEKIKNKEEVYDEAGKLLNATPLPVLDFDTLIIGDFGRRLSLVSSHLPFLDINYKKLNILGPSSWNDQTVFRDPVLANAFFPSYVEIGTTQFAAVYRSLYKKTPNAIQASAYDAMKLIASLAYLDSENQVIIDVTKQAILSYDGKDGVLGSFFMKEDGTNQRAMSVRSINNGKSKIVDSNTNYRAFMRVPNYQKMMIELAKNNEAKK